MQGKALHNVQNAMFAAAMAFSKNVKLEDIRHGLQTFDSTFFQAPGRLNFYDEHPFRVLLDYAHNAHAMEQVCGVVKLLDVQGRRIGVLSAPGDRRDEDIAAMAAATAGVFDAYICRRDDNLRGRGPDEVPEILARALVEAGVPAEAVRQVSDEQAAVDAALRMAAPGDLLVLFADALERTWDQIVDFSPDGAPSAASHRDGATEGAKGRNVRAGGTPVPGPAPGSILPDLPDVDLGPNQRLIRDERGVRLARDYEDD